LKGFRHPLGSKGQKQMRGKHARREIKGEEGTANQVKIFFPRELRKKEKYEEKVPRKKRGKQGTRHHPGKKRIVKKVCDRSTRQGKNKKHETS